MIDGGGSGSLMSGVSGRKKQLELARRRVVKVRSVLQWTLSSDGDRQA